MEIRRVDEHTIAIEDLDIFLCELLHQISVASETKEGGREHERLFSSPTHGAEPGFDEEWKEYVEPELRHAFQSSLDAVKADIESNLSEEQEGYYRLTVPVIHLESWIHALNQARLALGARYNVTDDDMDSMPIGADSRALAIFQIHFYGYLQECFLREMET